jgi:hypothetical protein
MSEEEEYVWNGESQFGLSGIVQGLIFRVNDWQLCSEEPLTPDISGGLDEAIELLCKLHDLLFVLEGGRITRRDGGGVIYESWGS